MTPIEILAALCGVVILAKLLILAFRPKSVNKMANMLESQAGKLSLPYLVLALVIGYVLLSDLTIVQLVASMAFTSTLAKSILMSLPETIKGAKKDLAGGEIIKKFWLHCLVLAGLAVWVLYTLFA